MTNGWLAAATSALAGLAATRVARVGRVGLPDAARVAGRAARAAASAASTVVAACSESGERETTVARRTPAEAELIAAALAAPDDPPCDASAEVLAAWEAETCQAMLRMETAARALRAERGVHRGDGGDR